MYDAVARWAGDDLRSVNAQIEYALRLALRAAGRHPRPGSSTPEPDEARASGASGASGQDLG